MEELFQTVRKTLDAVWNPCEAPHMNSIASIRQVEKSAIVKYQGGYYRVSAVIAGTVNLVGVFDSKSRFKRVPIADVVEAHDEWYAKWQQSESYQCM